MMPGVLERASHDYKRNGTSSLYAALNITTGKVIGQLHSRQRAVEFKKLLIAIDKEVPADLVVHLVLDNSSTHKTPAIQRWLLAHPRFVLHFTPTSSSWLNLVERWFGELTMKKLGFASSPDFTIHKYDFTGFFAPLRGEGGSVTAQAGRAMPVKFSLHGDQGMRVLETGSPGSAQITCGSHQITGALGSGEPAGSSGLTYDPGSDTYTYVWKTNKAWGGSCRQLVLTLDDGTQHVIEISFR